MRKLSLLTGFLRFTAAHMAKQATGNTMNERAHAGLQMHTFFQTLHPPHYRHVLIMWVNYSTFWEAGNYTHACLAYVLTRNTVVVPWTNMQPYSNFTEYSCHQRHTILGHWTVKIDDHMLLHPYKGSLEWVIDTGINFDPVPFRNMVLYKIIFCHADKDRAPQNHYPAG